MKSATTFLLCLCAVSRCAALPLDWNATIADSQPLNWYRFDELSGTTAFDHGSQGLDGSYGADALDAIRGVPGKVGTAVQFGDQSTVFLSAPDISGDWSAEFLLMRTGTKRSSVLIRGIPFELPSQALKLEQFSSTEAIGYTKYGIIDATFSPEASSPLNQWIHIVYVNQAAANRVQLYVNGSLVGERIDNFNLPRDQIGSWSDTIPESPLAVIDEVVLYNRALSPAEIAAHHAAIPEPSATALVVFAAVLAFVWHRPDDPSRSGIRRFERCDRSPT